VNVPPVVAADPLALALPAAEGLAAPEEAAGLGDAVPLQAANTSANTAKTLVTLDHPPGA